MQKKANRFKHAEFFQRLQAVRDTLNVVKAEAKGVRKVRGCPGGVLLLGLLL
jgi:hypothetical protein